jgi:hypothetical protein
LKEAENLLALTMPTRQPTRTEPEPEFDPDFPKLELGHRRSVPNVREDDRNLTLKPFGNLPGNFENIRTNSVKFDKKKRGTRKVPSPVSPISPVVPHSVTEAMDMSSPSNFISCSGYHSFYS